MKAKIVHQNSKIFLRALGSQQQTEITFWGEVMKSGQPHFLCCRCWRWAQPHSSSLCHFSYQLAATSANLKLTPILVNTP